MENVSECCFTCSYGPSFPTLQVDMREELQNVVDKMPALFAETFGKFNTEISETLRSQTQVGTGLSSQLTKTLLPTAFILIKCGLEVGKFRTGSRPP